MRHLKNVSMRLPVPADAAKHPSISYSVKEFLADPVGVIQLHLGKAQ